MYWKSQTIKKDDKTGRGTAGNLSYEELANFAVRVKSGLANDDISFYRDDIKNPDFITLSITLDSCTDTEMIQSIRTGLEKLMETLVSIYGKKPVTDESLNREEILAYLDAKDDITAYVFYAKYFARCSYNGIDRFAFSFSINGFVTGLLNLFYRKCYAAALSALGVYIVLYFAINIGALVLLLLFCGLMGPYFIYKRFRSVQKKTQSITDREQRLTAMKELGGVNMWFALLAIVIVIAGFFIGF
jgi:hypothetical protein